MFSYVYPMRTFDNFGLGYLNISEAAVLIVKCLKNKGVGCCGFDKEWVPLIDPEFDKNNRDEINDFQALLIKAITEEKIRTKVIKRDLKESIIPNETYIKAEDLQNWAEERGLYLGPPFDEFVDFQEEVVKKIHKFIEGEYAKLCDPKIEKNSEAIDEAELMTQLYELRTLKYEIDQAATSKKEKPISTRERETLLKMIIGMAVDGYGFDPNAGRSSLAKELSEIFTSQGIPITDDTIRKWLQEASQLFPQGKG